jgi:anti-sigma factor RsiW
MTKRCAEILPLLGALDDGTLDASERDEVGRHVEECTSCSDRLRFFRAQGDALREVMAARSATADFTGFADRVLLRARKEKARGLDGAGIWTREMVGAHRGIFGAAGVVLAACMALAVVFIPQPQGDESSPDPASQVEEVDFGTHDGAVLQLPHETTVIWMSEDHGAAK